SDSGEHIAEPTKRLDRVPLVRRDEAQQHSRRLAAMVAAEERPVAPPNRYAPVGPLGGPIVDLQIAVFQKAVQRLPLIQRVPDTALASGLFGKTSSRIPSRYWCSFSITGADSRWRNSSLSSPLSPWARSSTEYTRRDEVQHWPHALWIGVHCLNKIPARVHPASH